MVNTIKAAALSPLTFYKALADDTRLQSLLLITEQGELCVCDLMAALQQSQPKVSRHLAQLRKSGILQDRRQGQWVYYSLHPQLPSWAQEVLVLTAKQNPDYVSSARKNLTANCC